jgi:hypothetical protein
MCLGDALAHVTVANATVASKMNPIEKERPHAGDKNVQSL